MPDAAFTEDSDLIKGLLAQEDAAFRCAITRYQASMLYLARSLVGDKFADEVVQEAWFSLLKSLNTFEGRSSLKTWLLRIVANEAKSRLRRENRMTSLEAMTEGDSSGDQLGVLQGRFDGSGQWLQGPDNWLADNPEALLSRDELRDCMNLTIKSLPDLQAATFGLKEQQGHSLQEICNILQVSESNVRVLLHRARIKLYATIEHFQQTGECCSA